jgi:parallel beta-helix repeat protein
MAWGWAQPAQAQANMRVDDFGAVGNGIADDTASIQAALNATAAGAAVIFSPGKTYRIGDVARGLVPKSGTRLILYGATLTMSNQDGVRCRLLTIAGKARVTVSGGTLVGSRAGAPDWAIGIHLSDSSDIVIEDVVFRSFATDGVTVSGDAGCQRVRIERCQASGMGRNGMSLISGSEIRIADSLFENTNNPDAGMPRAGLGAEPNAGNRLSRVSIVGCRFRNNQGSGLLLQLGNGVSLTHLTVRDNIAESNGLGGLVLNAVSHALVVGNRVLGHASRNGYGIGVRQRATNVVVKANVLVGNFRGIYAEGAQVVSIVGNTVMGTGASGVLRGGDDGDGINLRGYSVIVNGQTQQIVASHAVVSGNLVRSSAGRGILVSQATQSNIANNVVLDSGQHGIQVQFGSTDSQVRGNIVARSSLESDDAYQDVFLSQTSSRLLVVQNQLRSGASVQAGLGMDNASHNVLSQNCLLGGPDVPLAVSPNAIGTSYNWRGSGNGWNRSAAGGAVQFLPDAASSLALALACLWCRVH